MSLKLRLLKKLLNASFLYLPRFKLIPWSAKKILSSENWWFEPLSTAPPLLIGFVFEYLCSPDIKVTQRGQMYIRHVRRLARKISGLQCVNADSQSYFIHKIQALCKSVFRDCCIELESSSDDVERAAAFTNHAEYLIQSMEILRPIPEDIAEITINYTQSRRTNPWSKRLWWLSLSWFRT